MIGRAFTVVGLRFEPAGGGHALRFHVKQKKKGGIEEERICDLEGDDYPCDTAEMATGSGSHKGPSLMAPFKGLLLDYILPESCYDEFFLNFNFLHGKSPLPVRRGKEGQKKEVGHEDNVSASLLFLSFFLFLMCLCCYERACVHTRFCTHRTEQTGGAGLAAAQTSGNLTWTRHHGNKITCSRNAIQLL